MLVGKHDHQPSTHVSDPRRHWLKLLLSFSLAPSQPFAMAFTARVFVLSLLVAGSIAKTVSDWEKTIRWLMILGGYIGDYRNPLLESLLTNQYNEIYEMTGGVEHCPTEELSSRLTNQIGS
jgi:hypothetical protein